MRILNFDICKKGIRFMYSKSFKFIAYIIIFVIAAATIYMYFYFADAGLSEVSAVVAAAGAISAIGCGGLWLAVGAILDQLEQINAKLGSDDDNTDEEDGWMCEKCGCTNVSEITVCEKCGHPRPQ